MELYSIKNNLCLKINTIQVVHEASTIIVLLGEEAIDDALCFSKRGLVCRFNGLQPCLVDLHQWISKNLLHDQNNIYPLAHHFFVEMFETLNDKNAIFNNGTWFWGRVGIFMQPWSPSFDPLTTSISFALVWVKLPNLPLHLVNISWLKAIGHAIGVFHFCNPKT